MALTKFNYNSFDVTTAASSGLAFNSSANGFDTAAAGALNLISTSTATNASSLSITSGIDGTYDTYLFKFIDINRGTGGTSEFGFNFSIDGGSNYNVSKTTTMFIAYGRESSSTETVTYRTGNDLANGTGIQHFMAPGDGFGAGTASAGELYLFNPSNTTFVKHFMGVSNHEGESGLTINGFVGGYCNTTSAVNAITFKKASGVFSGTVKMYGITK